MVRFGCVSVVILMFATHAGAQQPSEQPPRTPPDQTAATPSSTEADTAEPLRLTEQVEVTATRSMVGREMSPASSSVVLRADLERRNVVTVDQALSTVEGVYAYRTRGVSDNEMGIGMRGFSGRGTSQGRVLILLDGQPINNGYSGAVNWTALALSEVDRVEVVRGPFSSLYGGNAMGGVVNVMTRPINRRSADLSLQYGTYDTRLVSGRAGARLRERLGLGVAFEALTSDGYRTQEVLRTSTDSTATGGTPVTGVTRFLTRTGGVNYAVGLRGQNEYDRYSVRARAEYTFGPRAFGSFQYIRQANEYGWGAYETSVRDASGRALDSGNVIFQENGVWKRLTLTPSNYLGVVGQGSSNLFQAQLLRSTASRGEFRLQAGLLEAPGDTSGTPGTTATLAGGPGSTNEQANRGVFGNAQWSYAGLARHAFVTGVDARLDRGSVASQQTTDYLGDGILAARETYAYGEATTWALYAQDTFTVSDNLNLTYGGRFDAWRTANGASQKALGLPTEQFDDRDAQSLTGKAALVYRPRPGTVLRASAGTAFRSPSVFDLYRDTRLASGSLLLGNPDLEPERMKSWELGLRQDFGRRVGFDVAYFENRINGLIFRSVDPADPTGLTSRHFNAGRARTRGVEFGMTLRAGTWLTVRPTYTYSDPRIVENAGSPATVGKQVPFVATHVAAGSVTAARGSLALTGTARYQSAVFSSDTNTDTVRGVPGAYDEFAEVDVAASYRLRGHVSLTLSADNVFDRQYYLFYRNPGRVVTAGLRLQY